MSAFLRATIAEFLNLSDTAVLAELTLAYAREGFSEMHTDLPLTWWSDLADLRIALRELHHRRPEASSWPILLEFSIPRKEKRIDVVVLAGTKIFLLECKRGGADYDARRQIEEYALLLHYFHQPSRGRHIHPIVVSASPTQGMNVFAREYTDRDRTNPPSNHVIIFDEAQRAWDLRQNLRKFARNYSEPEMLLNIMQRHTDWAVIVALVGGGQEINDGEAGLEEWGKALRERSCHWQVYASNEVVEGGPSTAGHRLFAHDLPSAERFSLISPNPMLHLRTSNRSLRADNLARWVNALLAGDAEQAADCNIRFPVLLTRSLLAARDRLRNESLANSRYGLAGSSGAARLRAEGLEPGSDFHAGYPWHHWYLAPATDVRSSYACEVFATEFEIQGLELDWVGVCWGGDFVWTGDSWLSRDLRHGPLSRWGKIPSPSARVYRQNAYRVLLTRARQGMVLYVPKGEEADITRNPLDFDRTADFLIRCGAIAI